MGAPEDPLLGADLSTIIGPSNGSHIKYKSQNKLSSSARVLKNAFNTISDVAERINLANVITERSKNLFKMVYEAQTLKGRTHDAIASACVYIACRQEGVPRSFKELVAVSNVNKKEIGRCFQLILKEHDTNVDIITSGDFMERFCRNLNLATTVTRAATCIAKTATDDDIVSGRSPISVAAAAIYMASQASTYDKKSLPEIADIAGVSVGTLKQSYNLMLPRTAEIFPTELQQMISRKRKKASN